MNCVLPLDSNAREPISGSRMIEGYSRCIWRLEKGRCHANGCPKARGFRGPDVRTYLLTCRHATGIPRVATVPAVVGFAFYCTVRNQYLWTTSQAIAAAVLANE